MVLDDIVGQAVPVSIFKRGLTSNSLGHAYLFSGRQGLGKETLARVVAQELVKQGGPLSELHVLTGEGSIGIEEIRDLRAKASLASAGLSIWIVVGAERMTAEASNALLKTLEEPPEGTYFFLTTSTVQSLLPTIVSRCLHLPFRSVGEEEIMIWLRNRLGESYDEVKAEKIARLAQGSLGKAWQYWEGSLLKERQKVISKLIEIPKLSYAEILGLSQTWPEDRTQVVLELRFFLEWFRDILIVKNHIDSSLYNPEYKSELTELSAYYSNEDLFYIIKRIKETEKSIARNARIRFHLGILLLLIKKGALTQW